MPEVGMHRVHPSITALRLAELRRHSMTISYGAADADPQSGVFWPIDIRVLFLMV